MKQEEIIIWHTPDERPEVNSFVLVHYKCSNNVYESFYFVDINRFGDTPFDFKAENNILAWAMKPKGWKRD